MATLRAISKPAAIAGVIALTGLAAAPALAYPPGVDLTISCTATTVEAGATFSCTLENTDPAGPTDIVIGGLLGAGDGVSFALASVAAQDSGTFTKQLTAPTSPGTYEVVGTSAQETASTQVTVTDGAGSGFSVIVSADGTATVQGATPGCSVTFFVNGAAAGSGTVGSDGTVTVATGAQPGETVTASQTASDGCEAKDAAPVKVTVPGDSGGGGTRPTTPDTGANVALGVVAGLGALGLGGGLFAASRRKRV